MKDTIIFDLDGTLALIDHRRHFVECPRDQQNWDAFYEACDKDEPNQDLVQHLMYIYGLWQNIVIFSGRSMAVHAKTVEWLDKHSIYYDMLRMRPEGDFTPDDQLKKQWAEEWGIDRIALVFDDRDKVVKMWRSLGITCCQVAEGSF